MLIGTRQDSWRHLGFKHVNGPAKWGSYAKSRYIADVHRKYDVPLDDIARQIGDTHRTVQRLYRALMVLEQAEKLEVFDREDRYRPHGRVSVTEIVSLLERVEEVDYSGGVSEEDELPKLVDEVYAEVDQRCQACGGGYPFVIEQAGYRLRLQESGCDNTPRFIYQYLLLATRMRMDKRRRHADIDGGPLFECVAAEVARQYLGDGAESLVFGTASENGGFRNRLDSLCKRMGEGEGCGPHVVTRSRDAKLDVVVWKSFRDGLPGKMIGFGQCKTGTDWHHQLTQLQPDVFCDQLRSPPVLTPVRMFFVAEAPDRSQWRSAGS